MGTQEEVRNNYITTITDNDEELIFDVWTDRIIFIQRSKKDGDFEYKFSCFPISPQRTKDIVNLERVSYGTKLSIITVCCAFVMDIKENYFQDLISITFPCQVSKLVNFEENFINKTVKIQLFTR